MYSAPEWHAYQLKLIACIAVFLSYATSTAENEVKKKNSSG